MERRIRQSQITKFKRCRRSWALEYVAGLELARTGGQSKGARSLGHIVHKAVEAYYAGRDWFFEMSGDMAALIASESWSAEWDEHYKLAEIMMQGYVQWLEQTAADANEEVLFVEDQWELPIGTFHGDDVILTGRPDLVVRDTLTDLVIVTDTKTVQSINSVAVHSGQLLTYALILKMAHGIEAGVLRTNQLRKVKRTARATPPFYGRSEMLCTTDLLRSHYVHTMSALTEMVELMQVYEGEYGGIRNSRLYPNPTGDCSWDCDFLPVCRMIDDGSNYEHVLNIHYRHKPEAPLA